jgi:hypothetical protein
LAAGGKTAESSIPSILNSSADHNASKSQHILRSLPHAPLPTFFMDRFTFFTSSDSCTRVQDNFPRQLISTDTASLGLLSKPDSYSLVSNNQHHIPPYPPLFDCPVSFTLLPWSGTLTRFVWQAVSGAKYALPQLELVSDLFPIY